MSPLLVSELHDGDHKHKEQSTAAEEENVPGAHGTEHPLREPASDTIAEGLSQSINETNGLKYAIS